MYSSRLSLVILLVSSVIGSSLLCTSTQQKLIESIDALTVGFNHPIGIELYNLKTGKTFYSKNSRFLFTPASNLKLVLGLAALDTLGENYRFATSLMMDGHQKKGILQGNVYLKGSGDPSLTSTDIEELLKILLDQGITTIAGNFCIDQEEFAVESFAPGFTMDNIGKPWSTLARVLTIDRKALSVKPLYENDLVSNESLEATYFDIHSFIQNLLKNHAIELKGSLLFQKTPAQSKLLATHYSQELCLLLKKIMKDSDNLYADCLLKKLGAQTSKTPGNWHNGRCALQEFLHTRLDIPLEQTRIADGSGLSRYNLLSPHHLIKLLVWAHDRPYFNQFLETLSVAGVDGKLINRMTAIPGKVKAKTGTLNGISALSGYLETKEGTVAFSILSNGVIGDAACKTELEDALCQLLVNYRAQEINRPGRKLAPTSSKGVRVLHKITHEQKARVTISA
ncbi:D-alanyl-D-alanine carboxypeptidase/D-alanyl-D-alanine-endopeptidase [Candidatus Dependentiae bacterium]|nr:D-alanyl-D-alanine carboxypeptidase/D-alanyl-D-alanine-endopeptidase [Candidatus Dependentiae bacterium]